MQKQVKLLILQRIHTITNGLYETQIKFKGFIMLQRIDLCKFQPKQAYTLSPVASSDGTHERRKEMFTTN